MHRILLLLLFTPIAFAQDVGRYPWLDHFQPEHALARRISLPPGYVREQVESGSFGDWLRHLPLKPGTPPVRLFNGKLKNNQMVHAAVINLDVGDTDLQQCADAVIRLRAEFLFARGNYESISFDFTSGDPAEYSKWVQGWRPRVSGNKVSWKKTESVDSSYRTFREYMTTVMTYAGTYSLERQLMPIQNSLDLRIGDVFVQGGSPGHTVIVVDAARHEQTGARIFLLAQSYMPAQEMHLLKSPFDETPWYRLPFGQVLDTPEWSFSPQHLRRFP